MFCFQCQFLHSNLTDVIEKIWLIVNLRVPGNLNSSSFHSSISALLMCSQLQLISFLLILMSKQQQAFVPSRGRYHYMFYFQDLQVQQPC